MSGLMLSGYFLSAIGSMILAGWLLTHRARFGGASVSFAAALSLSALWAVSVLANGAAGIAQQLTFGGASLAWLWTLYRLFVQDGRHASLAPIRPVVAALVFVELLQIAVLVAVAVLNRAAAVDPLQHVIVPFRLLFCAGALVLVHNLYVGASSPNRASLRWPAAALAVLWAFDLNYDTVAYLSNGVPLALEVLRGCVPLAMVALLAIGAMAEDGQQTFRPSRSFAFRSFSLLLIGAYFLVMVVALRGLAAIGGDYVRLTQIAFLAIASALALVVLPSRKMRGWLRVTAIKHLFQHRYDYREEWLRFTRTMGRAGPGALPLPERVIQAVADVTDSPGGLLLTSAEDGGLTLEARWQWPIRTFPRRRSTRPARVSSPRPNSSSISTSGAPRSARACRRRPSPHGWPPCKTPGRSCRCYITSACSAWSCWRARRTCASSTGRISISCAWSAGNWRAISPSTPARTRSAKPSGSMSSTAASLS